MRGFAAYDGGWYYSVAVHGYPAEGSAANAFYPLFPLLVSGAKVVHVDTVMFGVALNTLLTGTSAAFLFLLGRDYFGGQERARDSVWWFLFFPTAFFLVMLYSEALFCALSFAAFYFARKRRWWAAGVCLALVTAVRFPGLIVAGAVAVEYLASRWERGRLRLDRQAWWFALAPLGFAVYAWFAYARYRDPLMMFHAYSLGEWPYQHLNPNIMATVWNQVHVVVGNITGTGGWQEPLMSLAMWLGAVALTAYGARKLPISYTAYSVITLLVIVANDNFVSVNRYLLPLFPIFLLLTKLTQDKHIPRAPLLGVSAALMGFWLLLFVNGYWVA